MPVSGQTPVRTHWEDSESIKLEKIGSPYTDPNDSTKLVQDVKSHRVAQSEVHASASVTINASTLPLVIFDDASPAAGIGVSLDSSIDDGKIFELLNESANTVTLTPTSGDINDGTGAASSKTLAAGTSCTLSKTSSGSPATAHWKMLKGSGGGGGTWGSITGTLSSQTDLQSALDAKATNPMTAVGDLIIGGTVTGGVAAPTRLGAGTSGYVLVSNGPSAAPSYQAVGTVGLPAWLRYHPDAYPTSANAMDDEFDAGSVNTSLWTALNSSANMPFTQANGRLIATPNNGGGAVRGYYQALPAGNWSFGTKVYINPSDSSTYSELGGIGLLESSTGKLAVWYVGRLAALNYSAVVDKWTSSGTSFVTRPVNQLIGLPPAIYLKIIYDGTNYGYWISFDGVAYTSFRIVSATTDFTTAANRIFVAAIDDKTSLDNPINWEYFRRFS